MVNRTVLVWMLRLIFVGVLGAHAAYLVQTGRSPQSNLNAYELLRFLWAPVASGVTAATGFYVVLEKWLWRRPRMRDYLVLLPDHTGTWLRPLPSTHS